MEFRFRAKQIFEEWDCFDFAVAALSKEVIQLCFSAVAHPDEDEPYTRLKEDLLQQHSLTKYQRIERMHAVGGLGSRRPTQLLAEMMELCPDDEEASCFFEFLFLQRLPAWLRVQLEADDQADIRQLVTREDRLFALGIPCWGEQRMELSFQGCRFTWTFLLAYVQFAIIGVQLLVDPAANRLVYTASLQAFATVSAPTAAACAACGGNQQDSKVSPSSTASAVAGRRDSRFSPSQTIAAEAAQVDSRISPPSAARAGAAAAAEATQLDSRISPHSAAQAGVAATAEAPPLLSPQWVKEFLEEFTDVVCASKVLPPQWSDVEHHIKMTGPPTTARFHRLDAEKLAAAKAEFLQLEKDRIVRRSDSPWSSPLHMVQKADGSWQPC